MKSRLTELTSRFLVLRRALLQSRSRRPRALTATEPHVTDLTHLTLLIFRRVRSRLHRVALTCTLLIAASAFSQTAPITLHVDATDAPRKMLHARLRIPARRGKLTLLYPKWLPGEHGPNGPITDLVGLKMSAAGKPVPWQRDPDD